MTATASRAMPGSAPLRLALFVAASVGLAVLASLPALAAVTALAAAAAFWAVACAGVSARTVGRRLLAVHGFALMVWLTVPWAVTPSGLAASPEGLALASRITLRLQALALAASVLLAGLDGFALARAAAALGLPPRLAQLMALTVRYLGVLDHTRRRLDRAARARGFTPRPDVRTLAVTAQMLALLLVHALLRAERVQMAMRARGFQAAARAGVAAAGPEPAAVPAAAGPVAAALPAAQAAAAGGPATAPR